ncbi:MAG: polysaccharide deacetylase family protein [Nitrospiraceae bacterium]|nr:MAG: polysaccharide deacetylase family protein [Nitrospiraceae bacterium]
MVKQEKLPARVVTFLYHEVTDDPTISGFQRKTALPYKHGTREFDENLEQIAMSPVSPTIVNEVDFGSDGRSLLLTFDDGGKSALHIADRLEKRGWKGHFFVTTSLIDTRTFLSKQDISELYGRGHIIGSHGHTHPDIFCSLRLETMLNEWKTSTEILSDIIQSPVVTASIPGGEMDFNTQLSAWQSGVRFLFTSEPILVPWSFGRLICLGRVYPKRGSSLRRVRNLAQCRGFNREIMNRKVKKLVKRLIYYPASKVRSLESIF